MRPSVKYPTPSEQHHLACSRARSTMLCLAGSVWVAEGAATSPHGDDAASQGEAELDVRTRIRNHQRHDDRQEEYDAGMRQCRDEAEKKRMGDRPLLAH